MFIGEPREGGKGIRHEGMGWSINAASAHKEGAWAFLRFFMEEEYQYGIDTQFPVLRAAWEEMLTEASEPVTYEVFIPELETTVLATSPRLIENREVEAMTQTQIDKVRGLEAEGVAFCWDMDENVWNIISEEAAAYLNGDKALEDVTDIIKRRLDMYLSGRQ